MDSAIVNSLKELFTETFNQDILEVTEMPGSGSYREYYRIKGDSQTVLGVYNRDQKENLAFIEFSKHFKSIGLRVPIIYSECADKYIYLIEDFGDVTLYQYIENIRGSGEDSGAIEDLYKRVVRELPKLQIEGGRELDYSFCYPRAAFDKQSMMWDLNYFKYYFLKLAKVHFDEQDLETDFDIFSEYLLTEESDFFLYRDFQSRNIMIQDDEICFIDYQGGRKGALQYDLASLLYDAKADISPQFRDELIDLYLTELERYKSVDREQFKMFMTGFVLIRIMQAMGAFGFRGFYEKKEHFLQSIPYALDNLESVLDNSVLPIDIPELLRTLKSLKDSEVLIKICEEQHPLKVVINSFSYKRGIPTDSSSNGGGYVFDCRGLHNPGRYDEYKKMTGLEEDVKLFFKKRPEMYNFLSSVYSLVDISMKSYIERGFNSLQVNFGCTGGQHRSVYSAEKLATYLRRRYSDIEIVVEHTNRENWNL